MFKILVNSVAAMIALFAFHANATATTEIDVNAYNANYGNYGTPVSVLLGAGVYQITFGYTGAAGQYQGWDYAASNFGQSNQAPAVAGCNANGANCTYGYVDSFGYVVNGAAGSAGSVYYLGPSSSNAGGSGEMYATAALALSAYTSNLTYTTFTLLSASTVTFFVPDSSYNVDNYGGVTLNVTSVPEPSSIVMFGFGLIGVGFIARRRAARGAGY